MLNITSSVAKMSKRTFSKNFIEETADTLGNSRFKDVKIILSDGLHEYLLHKVILAAASSFFRKLFYHEPKKVYEIGSVSKRGFDSVLGYIYLQTLTLTADNFDGIMAAALYLGCDEIVERMKNTSFLVKDNVAVLQIKGTSTIYIPRFESDIKWDLEEDSNYDME